MRATAVALVTLMLLSACSRQPEARRYEIRGQVLAVLSDRSEITLKHDDIKGFMPGMTMPFKVKDAAEIAAYTRGDLIAGTLVVVGDDAYLEQLSKIGRAEVMASSDLPAASAGFELLKAGDKVPDVSLVDEDGRTRRLADLQAGNALALTFIYTRCPLPNFCPMMDRHFAAIQESVKDDRAMRGKVRLVSVSFDPAYDTPAVLKKHARTVGADPSIWHFLTGDRDEVDRFASRFGVTVTRNEKDDRDITHNLRTAVINADGTIVKVYTGFDWTPRQVLGDLSGLTGAR